MSLTFEGEKLILLRCRWPRSFREGPEGSLRLEKGPENF